MTTTQAPPPSVEVIRHGVASVRLYRMKNRGRPLWCLAYQEGGKRVRRNFAEEAVARREAKAKARMFAEGQHAALHLTNDDASAYLAALDVVKPFAKRLDVAAGEWAEAARILAGAGSLAEAARYFMRHHGKMEAKLIPDLAREFYEAKKQDGASPRYLEDIHARLLGRFCGAFAGYIGNLTSREIDDWLRGLKVSGRTRNNYRNLIVTLFAYAKGRGYLPKDRSTEAEAVSEAKEAPGKIGILTPKQMTNLLTTADASLVPFLAIGGFAGLRVAEIERLDWSEVDFKKKHIVVAADKAKTAQRRLAPLSDNLAAWLQKHRKCSGLVAPGSPGTAEGKRNVSALMALAAKVKLAWPHNGLRHSFASYRLAEIKNAAQVALEMGNSPAMVFSNYREVVAEDAAREWFAIMPPAKKGKQKIVEFPKQEAA